MKKEKPFTQEDRNKEKPFTAHLEVDFMQLFLFIAALATRTYQLGLPRAVV